MREMKARAWHKELKKMFPVVGISWGKYPSVQVDEDGFYRTFPMDHVVVMPFTTAFDNKGKEIYQGDICRAIHEDEYHEHDSDCEIGCDLGEGWEKFDVRWDEQATGFTFPATELFGDEYDYGLGGAGDYKIEVIGNIHETQRL